jgi:hypothetical protein
MLCIGAMMPHTSTVASPATEVKTGTEGWTSVAKQ